MRIPLDSDAVKYAIDIDGLTKIFKRHTLQRGSYTTIKSSLFSFFKPSSRPKNVTHAVKELTCRIPQGASVGIIGRNGSGKSTLLKLITGIYKPTSGRVKVNGRIAALIELGAGFHPDFSGRENLYLAGIMHGLSKREIDDRFDEIVEFAGLEEVIDDAVRTYSSGMFMRLGFSVAVHCNPDVLLVDEVLAVGDAAFVRKCKDQISALRKEGKTLLLVSHDLDAVERWSDEVIWLNKGEVKDRGEPRRVIDSYREFLEKGEELELDKANTINQEALTSNGIPNAECERWGSREVEITKVTLLNSNGAEHSLFHADEPLTVKIDFIVRDESKIEPPNDRDVTHDLVFGIAIHRSDGVLVYGTNTEIEDYRLPRINGGGEVRLKISRLGLLEGAYAVDVAAHRFDGYSFDYHKKAITFLARSQYREVGVFTPEHSWEIRSLVGEIKRAAHD